MTAHRAWSLVGVTAQGGHGGDGFGLCGHDWKAAGVSLLGSGTLGASAVGSSPWTLAGAISGGTGSGNGWYSGSGFVGSRIWYDFGAGTPAAPDTVTFCSLNSFPWTTGQAVAIEWTDDDPAASPTWTRDYVIAGYTSSDNTILSFPTLAPPPNIPQLAYIPAVDQAGGDAHVTQMAFVAVFSETPPFAAGALANQMAMVIVASLNGNPSQAMMGTF